VPTLDVIAVAWFAALVGGYHCVLRWRPPARPSILSAVQRHRLAWMRNMALRDNRAIDAVLIGTLSHGNAFFASTSVIAIGGTTAAMGAADHVQDLFERLPYVAKAAPSVWAAKVLLLGSIFVYAFFKFAWAFRLSDFTAIFVGATPLPELANTAACEEHAERTAALIGIVADHASSGLRAFYHAIAVLAWFFHPLLFMAATAAVLAILVRRDFYSRARDILRGPTAWPPRGSTSPSK
jgi:uncharacterized membrane protein